MHMQNPSWILDLMPEAISHVGADQRYIYANRAYQNLLKKPLSAIQGTTILESLGEEIYRRHLPHIKKVLSGHEVNFETQILFPKGDLKHISVRYIPQLNEFQQVTSFVVLSTDISEKVREEQKRIESEQIQETYFHIPNIMFCIAGNDGYFKKLNPTWEAITGHSVQELLSHPFLHFVHPDDREKTIKEASAISNGAKSVHFKNRYQCKDGSYRWIEWNSVPRGENIYAVARDVTEVYLAELALKESEAKFRQWFEAIPQIVWTTDKKGYSNYFNNRWYEYTGLTIDGYKPEILGKVIHPEDLSRFLDIWTRSLETQASFEISFRLKKFDGNYRWYLGRSIPVLNQTGEVIQWIGTATDIHDQLEHERLAFEWRQRTDAILSNADMLLWSADEKGVITFSQGNALKKYGVSTESRIGINLFEYYKDDPSAISAFEKVYQGHPVNQEVSVLGGYFNVYLNPLKDSFGKTTGIVGVSLDISEMKRAESVAKTSEDRFKAIIEQSPIPMAMFNLNGKPTKINRAFQELWGLSDEVSESFYQHEYNIHTDPLLRQLGLEPFIQLAFQGKNVSAPAVFYDPSVAGLPGQSRWVESYFSSVTHNDGKPSEIILVFNDITARKISEDSVRAKQQELQSIIDYSPAIIYVKDLEGRALIVNAEFEKVIGKSRCEVLGKSDFELFPKLVAEKYRESDLSVAQNADPVKYEEEVSSPEGGSRSYFSIKFPIKNAHGSVIAVGGITTDITIEKKLQAEKYASKIREEAALQASNLKSTFLANMSHEIRTPIAGVIGMSEFLLDSNLDETQRSHASTLKATAEGLLSVINDILDFSKIEAGKLDIENTTFNLSKLARSTVESLQFAALKRNLDFILEIPESLNKRYYGDPNRIRQVLLNLISNAIKFTPSGSVKLTVSSNSACLNQESIYFEVSDTGIGISNDTLKKLFHPFTQEDSSITRKYGGTGLGLSISKNLVSLMGGEIGVKSTLGSGSTFWFSIPLTLGDLSAEGSSKNATKVDLGKLNGLKVLVVEDNAVNQLIAQRMLEKQGLRPALVKNGLEAIEQLRNFEFDLVMMDCQMPEMDGFTATRIIRTDSSIRNRTIPIIAMTANAMRGDRERCLKAGMNDYISKPMKKLELADVIAHVLSTVQTVQ
jgi:PAS domain S-box-containing protein